MIIWEAIHRLVVIEPVEQLDQGILLIVIAGVVNFLMGWLAKRTGQRNHSLALESSGRHLLSDAYSTFGLIAGLILLRVTEIAWLDSAVAIVFGLIIFVTGYRILRRSIAGIMDEADEALLRELIAHLNEVRRESWVDIHNLRIIKYGSVLHIDCHLTVPWYFHVQQSPSRCPGAIGAGPVWRPGRAVRAYGWLSSCRLSPVQPGDMPRTPISVYPAAGLDPGKCLSNERPPSMRNEFFHSWQNLVC
ncbi:MAG: cation diffusion facilitator family transporter [Saprospiraceae bacterium]